MIRLDKHKKLTTNRRNEINMELVEEAVSIHSTKLRPIYLENEDIYLGQHEILKAKPKAKPKPDNRLVVNLSKYIVDTFEGFRMGIPLRTKHPDKKVFEFIEQFNRENNVDDLFSENSKSTSIYGHAFFYVYQNEEGKTKVVNLDPTNTLIVYDNSIISKPMFAVRYVLDKHGKIDSGELITGKYRRQILSNDDGNYLDEEVKHIYDYLPVIESVSNNERQGLFDNVKTLNNQLNKTMSEKANDVDYFADAYMKIHTKEKLPSNFMVDFRENRIINTHGDEVGDVSFIDKPDADKTQENLIDHLWNDIFTISMVADFSDHKFGNASGKTMAYKLQAMSNMAKLKDRKYQNALHELYKVVFSVPDTTVSKNDYLGIDYSFSRNLPNNLKEEAEIINLLDGKISKRTLFSLFSPIGNTDEEIEQIKLEDEEYNQAILDRLNRHQVDGDI